jgi:Zn-dependent protease with chaperone function
MIKPTHEKCHHFRVNGIEMFTGGLSWTRLMAMKKVPFSRQPVSQFRIPAFYFRGGDILREREYLADEYKKALSNYRRAQFALRQIESDLRVAGATLNERADELPRCRH